MKQTNTTIKKNVSRFDEDVRTTGSYAYTTERLSARLANMRITSAIAAAYPFAGKRVLDLGCGDGAYTVEFAALGVASVLGIDPASVAIEAAKKRAAQMGLDERVHFVTGNIYEINALLREQEFDVIALRGVLHHLPDPARAIAGLADFQGTILILEPNGLNPVLKLLEKFSRYHIEHEERSFTPATISRWLSDAGLREQSRSLINLVPFFCPDWMASILRHIEPFVEKVPLLRAMACGQTLLTARR